MAYSEKKAITNKRYDDAHYDKITAKIPKGTKDLILSSGYTVNSFVNEAIQEKLNRLKEKAV